VEALSTCDTVQSEDIPVYHIFTRVESKEETYFAIGLTEIMPEHILCFVREWV
jgi:hypothetical protein